MFRLGIDEAMADALSQLTLPEMVKLAETNQLVCQFRFNDHNIINRLTQESRVDDLQQIHTGILLSSRLLRDAAKDEAPKKEGGIMSEKYCSGSARYSARNGTDHARRAFTNAGKRNTAQPWPLN